MLSSHTSKRDLQDKQLDPPDYSSMKDNFVSIIIPFTFKKPNMSIKYYHIEPIIHEKQWELVFSKALNECDRVDIFTELPQQDIVRRKVIEEAIKNPVPHFEGCEIESVSVTQKPFLRIEKNLLLVHSYRFTEHISSLLKQRILMAEPGDVPTFTFYNQDQPFFHYDMIPAFFLLADGEYEVAKSLDFKLSEYKLLYNETIDGTPDTYG